MEKEKKECYEAPSMKRIEMDVRRVFCDSGIIEDYGNEDWNPFGD